MQEVPGGLEDWRGMWMAVVFSCVALGGLAGLDWAYGPWLWRTGNCLRRLDQRVADVLFFSMVALAVVPRLLLTNVNPMNARRLHESLRPEFVTTGRVLDAVLVVLLALIVVSGILSELTLRGVRVQSRPVGDESEDVDLAVTKEARFPACCVEVSVWNRNRPDIRTLHGLARKHPDCPP